MQMQTYVLPHAPHPHQQQQHPGQPFGNESVLQFQQQQQRRAGGPPPWAADGNSKGKARQEGVVRIPQLDGPSSIPQLDGASSTSSASSSTPPPGAGLTGSAAAVKPQSGAGVTASEEINSDLDDSDSDGEAAEEAETGGPEQDIVFCTYDKVSHTTDTMAPHDTDWR
jgi:transcription initiation factor TFIIA large subunit